MKEVHQRTSPFHYSFILLKWILFLKFYIYINGIYFIWYFIAFFSIRIYCNNICISTSMHINIKNTYNSNMSIYSNVKNFSCTLAKLFWWTNSLQKTLMLGKIEWRKWRGWQRIRWLDASPTQWTWKVKSSERRSVMSNSLWPHGP